VHGEAVFFAVTEPRDVIQRYHLSGLFYETEELDLIKQYFPIGGRFFDIGANVGNHSLYVAKFLRARSVVPVEINPVAFQTLRANMVLNQVDGVVDDSWLGLGVSSENCDSATIRFHSRNIGGGKVALEGGDLQLVTADTIADGRNFDMIKIDVEGMELKVLAGLFETIERSRPRIFVEVDNENADAFLEWVKENGYRVAGQFRRYRANENFMLVPKRPVVWRRIRTALKAKQMKEAKQ
jgi:FkbM family methyltransferase